MINDFLSLDIINSNEKELLIHIARLRLLREENKFIALFEVFCDIVYQLMIIKQVSLHFEVCIRFNGESIVDQCKKVFNSYFGDEKKIFEKYKKPKCNKSVCTSLDKPQTSWRLIGGPTSNYYIFKVANVVHNQSDWYW